MPTFKGKSDNNRGMKRLGYFCFVLGCSFLSAGVFGKTLTLFHDNMNEADVGSGDVTIDSSLPTAAIVGGGSICAGDSLQAFLYMTGTAPWEVVVEDSKGIDTVMTGIGSPHPIWLKPVEDESYSVSSVVDGNGISGNTFGKVDVVVNEPAPVNILLDRTTYLASEPGVELRADIEPGIFSGTGVSAGYFYPSIATPAGSPHRVTYAYENQFGCVSYDFVDIEVVEGSGTVHLLSGEDTVNVLCDDEGIYEIKGSNEEGIAGNFTLRVTNSSTVVPGHIDDEDLTDNLAYFDPTGLSGGYDIIYEYGVDQVTLTASLFIRVDEVGSLEITGSLPDQVCKNDEPYRLTGNMDGVDPLATYSFGGPGVSGNQSGGFYYDPGDPSAPVGTNRITYEYITESGCRAMVQKSVTNSFVPDVKFAVSTVCIPEGGGRVSFSNQTAGKYSVDLWNWEFGDINSGIENFSNQENPGHFYRDPGQRTINLTATTHEGCTATYTLDTLLADKPHADFTWLSDCFIPGKNMEFINQSEASFSAIDTFIWTFRTERGSVLGETGTGSSQDTISFPFSSQANYTVGLQAINSGGCSDEIIREIALKPTVVLTPDGYAEDFNGSEASWSIQSDDSVESWVWGVPDFNGYEPAAGDRAWYTDLPFGVVGYSENSWIQSPCFDFSKMKRPLIQVDIMRSFVPNLSGAVLQYQNAIEEGWKTVGLYREGIEWYNSNTIFNSPGESSFGWSLNAFEPDREWVTTIHDLDLVAGRSGIKFRFVIGTNGGQQIGNQGFAFDNVHIAERTKRSVLEYFTSSADGASRSADDQVDRYFDENSNDVIDIQYHMSYPGADPMNANNPDAASTRAGNLGVAQVPFAVLNGGVEAGHRYDFSGPDQVPVSDELKLLSLEIPLFDLDLAVDWHANSLEATSRITCRADGYTSSIQLYMVVIETSVTAYTGMNQDTMFRNVVLDMLPTPAGKLLGNGWYRGKSDTRTYSWTYPGYVEDVEDLAVVAFLQDRETGRILQADAIFLTPQVGIGKQEHDRPVSLFIYPNPVRDRVYINLGDRSSGEGRFELVDLSGKVVMLEEVPPGYAVFRLDVARLIRGTYILQWVESGMLKGRCKMIKIR